MQGQVIHYSEHAHMHCTCAQSDIYILIQSYSYSGTSDKGHSEIRTTSDNGQAQKMHQLDSLCKLTSEMRTLSLTVQEVVAGA